VQRGALQTSQRNACSQDASPQDAALQVAPQQATLQRATPQQAVPQQAVPHQAASLRIQALQRAAQQAASQLSQPTNSPLNLHPNYPPEDSPIYQTGLPIVGFLQTWQGPPEMPFSSVASSTPTLSENWANLSTAPQFGNQAQNIAQPHAHQTLVGQARWNAMLEEFGNEYQHEVHPLEYFTQVREPEAEVPYTKFAD
jgi:hypothetical protein